MLLAVVEIPKSAEAMDQAARLCGLVRYDLNQRLGGPLPRVLLSAADAGVVAALAEALEALGFVTFTCDPAAVPSEGTCVVARRLEFHPGGLTVYDPGGAAHECTPDALVLMQRGQRISTATKAIKNTERKFSLGRAALTGGLMMTRKVETQTIQDAGSVEAFLAIQRGGGQHDILLYEGRLDYRFLGEEMAPASGANLQHTAQRLRQLFPHVPFDERIARPGYVSGLPRTAADPVDLALFLVRQAYLHRGTLPP